MSCNCITELKERLNKKYDSEIELTNMEYKLFMEGGDFWPSLLFKYHPKNTDGSKSKKWNTSRVFPSYCPVCGKKYDDG